MTEAERQNILESEFKGKNCSEDITILLLNQLRTAHVQLAASIVKINRALDTKCQRYSLVQDLNHIIWQ